jgi:hypothetical protein
MPNLDSVIKSTIAKEPMFAIDDFKQTFKLTGLEAILSRLLTLLYMEPGTIRDVYNMGINIKQYLFERITESDVDTIQQAINFQLSTYFKTEYGNVTALCFLSDEEGVSGKTLNVTFEFSRPLDDKGHRKLTINFDKTRVLKSISDISIFVS